MQVSRHAVVTISYTLTAPDGEVLDQSADGAPLAYLHGTGALVPGFEAALEGKSKGERFEARVAPADAYGERDERLVQVIDRQQLPPGIALEVGTELQARSPEGDLVVTVVEIAGERVTLDGNHPLAGLELQFAGAIEDVRAATREELAHGHVHGPGGHHA